MKYSMQTGVLEERYGIDETYRLIAEAGFDAVDVNSNRLYTYGDICAEKILPAFRPGGSADETLAYFADWGKAAEKYGIDNYQFHAPFPTFVPQGGSDVYNAYLIEVLRKTIAGAASIGCRKLIVHPFFYDYEHTCTPEEEWNRNIESYLKLAEEAQRYDMTICLENMFTVKSGKVYAAICNDPYEAARYIDTLNEAAGRKIYAFCMDTGHALLVGHNIRTFLNVLGKRIEAFHVHDNDGVNDQHLAPYRGILDWELFRAGLKDIGYDGTMSFEIENEWKRVPEALYPQTLRYVLECARYLGSE